MHRFAMERPAAGWGAGKDLKEKRRLAEAGAAAPNRDEPHRQCNGGFYPP